MASVARVRRCKTCKNVFIDPESLRKHKVYGNCRSHEALQAAGFYSGPVDGNLGPNTMAAVGAFQKSKGLADDGYLTVETVKALGIAPQ